MYLQLRRYSNYGYILVFCIIVSPYNGGAEVTACADEARGERVQRSWRRVVLVFWLWWIGRRSVSGKVC